MSRPTFGRCKRCGTPLERVTPPPAIAHYIGDEKGTEKTVERQPYFECPNCHYRPDLDTNSGG